ncbi:GNAT family N-acetyltransferase, partial [Phytoactinopolyspora endophytica]|uniref:GNAT family N-acetyltransferase n=1 Tax=Phytoactinopolyspora endophytica TaxID=1642495 RepID=UPI0013EE3752
MMRLEIRPAQAGDLAAVEDVVATAYHRWASHLGIRPAPLDADYAELIVSGHVYVACHDAVDGVIVLIDEDDCLVVENVAVRPDAQGRGIGRALLAFAEREATRRKLPSLRLYTHEKMESNVTLYQALGYVETHREPVPVG